MTGQKSEFLCLPVGDDVDVSEDDRIAALGRPQLGEIGAIVCNISESIEFKASSMRGLYRLQYQAIYNVCNRDRFGEMLTATQSAVRRKYIDYLSVYLTMRDGAAR